MVQNVKYFLVQNLTHKLNGMSKISQKLRKSFLNIKYVELYTRGMDIIFRIK